MKYIKCPRCNLNYIIDGEEYCEVCKSEIGYTGQAKVDEIENIYEYVCNVFNDFEQYVETSSSLCDLKSITFEGNCLPDYNNVHVQQLYLLRYAYAYAFEYKFMYSNLFANNVIEEFAISVLSIGCGNMIDYWGLVKALKEQKEYSRTIFYTGIDVVDWQYKVKTRKKDIVLFNKTDIVDYLNKQTELSSDIYFFPKSISEFSDDAFNAICNCFKTKYILKNNIYLLVSIRPVGIWSSKDIERVAKLTKAITFNGYSTIDNPNTYYFPKMNEENIWQLDNDFNYPTEIIDIMKNLTTKCVANNSDNLECAKCDKINRSPILKAKYVQYQMLTFHREK